MTSLSLHGCLLSILVTQAAIAADTRGTDLARWRDGGQARIVDEGTHVFIAALVNPPLTIPDGGLALSWRQRRDVSWASSAGVLDVTVDGGAWRDVAAIGVQFGDGDDGARTFAGSPLGERRGSGCIAGFRCEAG